MFLFGLVSGSIYEYVIFALSPSPSLQVPTQISGHTYIAG